MNFIFKIISSFFLLWMLFGIQRISFAQEKFPFIENKGQWEKNVLFKAHLPVGNLYLEKNKFTFDLFPKKDRHHRHDSKFNIQHSTFNISERQVYQMTFLGSNENSKLVKESASNEYENYFIGSDKSKWASNVKKFAEINYINFYENIDLKIYRGEKHIEYGFLISKNGNPDKIKIQYSGQDKILIQDGNLIIKTKVCDVTELKPIAYQEINGKRESIACNFMLKDSTVWFDFPEGYNKNYSLIIDPELIFSTYTGSSADNWGFTATYDGLGKVYSGGIVNNVGYPIFGAVQGNHAGAPGTWDIGIIKYSPDGANRLWATYLGGSSSEMPHSMVVDEYNNLLVFGTTGSADFPVSSDAFDTTFNGGDTISFDGSIFFNQGVDIFITKISENGSNLIGSTYIGGAVNDGFNYKRYIDTIPIFQMQGNDSLYYNYGDGARGEIICDNRNNVYVGSCTFSNNFPITSNTFQQTNHGKEEGVVFKMNADLSQMIWSSYIGGTEDDAIYSLDLDKNNNVYVCGGTVSYNFPFTQDAYSTVFNGGTTDGFVAKISTDGTTLVSSTFFGSSAYDQAYIVKLDKFDNAYIAGQTKALGTTLIHNALYNVPNSGQFIAKFNPALDSLIWSTVFGTGSGKPNISITAFTVDVCNRIYLSGWGKEWASSPPYNGGTILQNWNLISGTKGMPVTSDAYQSVTDGQDFYVMVISDDASTLEYATYFGEQHYYCPNANNDPCYFSGHDHVDGGTSRFDKKGNIYQSVCASCGSFNNFPTFPGNVWSPNNNSGNCNNAVFRFSFAEDFSIADFVSPPSGCSPYTVNFTNTGLGTIFHWDFGDGDTSSSQNPTHTYSQIGSYNVTLISSNPTTCNISDTIVKLIQVRSNHTDSIALASICMGDSIQIGNQTNSDPNISYHWFPQTGLSNPNISHPWTNVSSTTQYLLVVTNGSCSDSIYQKVVVQTENYNITARIDTSICYGNGVLLSATTGFQTESYQWFTSLNFTNPINPDIYTSYFTVHPTETTTYYIRGNGIVCEDYKIDSVTIQVNKVETIISTDTTICKGDTISIHVQNQILGNNLSYQWYPNSSIISGADTNTAVVNPTSTSDFYVTTNQFGCSKIDTITITVSSLTITPHSQNVNCFGECNGAASVNTTGTNPMQYYWNNGNTNSSLTNLCPGHYSITVTDLFGCKKSSEINILEPAKLRLSLQISPIIKCGTCTGQIIATGLGGTTPYLYHWSNNLNNNTISNLCYGNYNVTLSDSHGCFDTTSVQLPDPSTLQANIVNLDNISCYNSCNGSISVSLTGGVSPYSYLWNNGETNSTLNNLCSGSYSVIITDADTCSRTKQFYLPEPSAINPIIHAQSGIRCHNDTTSISASVTNGFPPYSFLWNDTLQHTTQAIHGIPSGNYQVIVIDSHNCSDTSKISLQNPTLLVADTMLKNSLCTISCDGEIRLNLTGGANPYTISWSDNSKENSNDTLRTKLCAGDYSATITDHNGCKILKQFHIDTVGYAPHIDATADDITIYIGSSTTLHAIGANGAFYKWSPAISLSDASAVNPIAHPTKTTLFYVWTSDATDCKNSDTITIFVEDVFCREPYIFVPNAFSPNGDGSNDVLNVQTNMARDVFFIIYDRWGEKIFESTNINHGWDGTYKGKMLDPAVFVFYVKVTCFNGEIFEKNGNVTLLK